jgi:hypothetical protein
MRVVGTKSIAQLLLMTPAFIPNRIVVTLVARLRRLPELY